jgi:hypothetical protein
MTTDAGKSGAKDTTHYSFFYVTKSVSTVGTCIIIASII